MTSSTKPEVHNVFLSHHIIRTENLVKFGHVFFEIRERTERQTDRHTLIAILITPTGCEVTIKRSAGLLTESSGDHIGPNSEEKK